jgi:hypothetical protein
MLLDIRGLLGANNGHVQIAYWSLKTDPLIAVLNPWDLTVNVKNTKGVFSRPNAFSQGPWEVRSA